MWHNDNSERFSVTSKLYSQGDSSGIANRSFEFLSCTALPFNDSTPGFSDQIMGSEKVERERETG